MTIDDDENIVRFIGHDVKNASDVTDKKDIHIPLDDVDMAVLQFNRTLKFRSESEDKPLNQIYTEELTNLSKITSISNEAFAKNDKFQSF